MKAFSLNSDKKQGFAFNLPLILVVLIFIIVPVAGTLITGFFRDVTFLPEKFIGFENYRRLFTDIHFRDSLIFTILFVLVSVTLEIILWNNFRARVKRKISRPRISSRSNFNPLGYSNSNFGKGLAANLQF